MFTAGDTVLYGAHGVCRIETIEKKSFGKVQKEYFVLHPVFDPNAVIYVPTDNDNLTKKMKNVLSPEKIHEIIDALPTQEPIWIENENARREHYRDILDRADRSELARMIKTLYLYRQEQAAHGKKLHMVDERFFKDAEKLLYDEFALVLGISRAEVLPFIQKRIPQGAQ